MCIEDVIIKRFQADYNDVDDEFDFDPADLKDLHEGIRKVVVSRIWNESPDFIDEVHIHFILKDDEEFTIEMERGSDDVFVERWDW